jgi:hypothetical protein
MMEQEIRCSECSNRGDKPTLLGIVENAEGVLRLWCKKCRKEIRVEITSGHIYTHFTIS